MRKILTILILASTFVGVHAAKPTQSCDSLQARCDSLQLRCTELQNRLSALQLEASRYVLPLIALSNDTTPLADFDVKKAGEAIDLYNKGSEIVALINPVPDFNAAAFIPSLQLRADAAGSVKKGMQLLGTTYTADQSIKLNEELTRLSQNKKLSEEQRSQCKVVAQTLANDKPLRDDLIKFLKGFQDYACIPDAETASAAYQDFDNKFLSKYVKDDKDNIPERYVLLHSTIKEITGTLKNYKGSLREPARFKTWTQNFINKLTVK